MLLRPAVTFWTFVLRTFMPVANDTLGDFRCAFSDGDTRDAFTGGHAED